MCFIPVLRLVKKRVRIHLFAFYASAEWLVTEGVFKNCVATCGYQVRICCAGGQFESSWRMAVLLWGKLNGLNVAAEKSDFFLKSDFSANVPVATNCMWNICCIESDLSSALWQIPCHCMKMFFPRKSLLIVKKLGEMRLLLLNLFYSKGVLKLFTVCHFYQGYTV